MTIGEPPATSRSSEAGAILAASAIVFVIALAAFQHISATGSTGGAGGDAADAGELVWPKEAAAQAFSDPDLGLTVTIPGAWERSFEDPAPGGADVRAVFVDAADSARLELEAWDAAGLAPFALWLGVVAGGMTPVSTAPLPNAMLAGTPAWVLWRPASDDAPAAYAAFLERDGRYYRLTHQGDADAGAGDFRRILASVAWPDGSGTVSIPKWQEGGAP